MCWEIGSEGIKPATQLEVGIWRLLHDIKKDQPWMGERHSNFFADVGFVCNNTPVAAAMLTDTQTSLLIFTSPPPCACMHTLKTESKKEVFHPLTWDTSLATCVRLLALLGLSGFLSACLASSIRWSDLSMTSSALEIILEHKSKGM